MLLYHGTSAEYLDSIMRDGLRPRAETKNSNYKEHPSRQDCVYLTDAYAPYFAAVAADNKANWLLIEVDIPLERLWPDEDFLEQTGYGLKEKQGKSIKQRTAFYKKHLHEYAHLAEDSLKHLGTVALHGGVSSVDIVRTSVFDPQSNSYIVMTALDPSISVLNYKFMADKYRALNRWFFEDDITPVDLNGELLSFMDEEQIRQQATVLTKRSGLNITKYRI